MPWAGFSENGQGSEERGPNDYSINPGNTITQNPIAQVGAVQNEIKGKNDPYNHAPVIGPGQGTPGLLNDKTIGMLLKLNEAVVAPRVKEMQQEQFIAGMTQAASGVAMSDIKKEQPWYTKVWGDSPAVEGAQAYTVQTKVTQFMADQANNMDQLRQVDPSQIPKHVMGLVKGVMTGDANTDGLIQMQVGRQLPALLKQQAKENWAWNQQQAADARYKSYGADASKLQSMLAAPQGMQSGDDIAALSEQYVASLVPAPGANIDAWNKTMLQHIADQAQSGNFHSINVLKTSGILDNLHAEDKLKVQPLIEAGQAKARARYMETQAENIAKWHYDAASGNSSPQSVFEQAKGMNEEYKRLSGDQDGFLKGTTVASMGSSAAMAVARVQAAAAKEALKAQGSEALRSSTESIVWQGGKSAYISNGGKADYYDDTMYQTFGKTMTDNPPAALKLLEVNAMNGEINQSIKKDIGRWTSTTGEAVNDDFVKAYGLWKNLGTSQYGPNAQNGYWDDHAIIKMKAFDAKLNGRDPLVFGEEAYQYAKQARAGQHPMEKKVAESIRSELEGGLFTKGAIEGLNDHSKRIIVDRVYRTMDAVNDAPGRTSVDNALKRLQGQGMEVVGGYVWNRDAAASQPPLMQYMANDGIPLMDSVGLDKRFKFLVDQKQKAAHGEADPEATVLRRQDVNGRAVFIVYPSNGKVPVQFTSDDIKAMQAKDVQQALNPMFDSPIQPYFGNPNRM